MIAYIVQHAEKERFPGDPTLTARGRQQARSLARHFKSCAVDVVVSSPYRRAVETARPVADALGLALQRDDRLRERMTWNGDQSLQEFLREWNEATRNRDLIPQFGDSSHAAGARFVAAVESSAALGVAILVTHGGVTCDALRNFLADSDLSGRIPSWSQGIPNAAITTVDVRRSGWRLVQIADAGHLAERQ